MGLMWIAYRVYIGQIPSVSDSYRTVDKRIYHGFFALFAALIWAQEFYTWKPVIENFLAYGMWILAGLAFYCIAICAAFYKKGEEVGHVAFTYSAIAIMLVIACIQSYPSWVTFIGPVVMIVGALGIHFSKLKNKTMKQEDLAAAILVAMLIQKP
jgi:hypothetical protein